MSFDTGFYLVDHRLIAVAMVALLAVASKARESGPGSGFN